MERTNKILKISTIVISLIAVAAIVTLSIFLSRNIRESTTLGNDLENVYQRAYYELVSNVNNMEINLSKLKVTSSTSARVEILNELSKCSQISTTALATLSAENYGVINTTRYINQTGDFAIYLQKKIIDGEDISEDDYEIINNLYDMTRDMGRELALINDEIAKGDYNFVERLNDSDDIFSEVFMRLEESVVEIPALIYDGPFSSSLLEKEPKAVTGEEITPEEGIQEIKTILNDFGVKEIEYTGENNSFIPMYNYDALTENDEHISIEITQQGGHLVMLNISRTIEEPSYTPEECAELAEQYLESFGFENMKSVWVSNYNSSIYVNLAPVIDDIVWYPDLIKVKIASNTGELIGFEGLSYYYNHTQRDIESPTISQEEAISSISKNLTIETIRLALIPLEKGSEQLAYEFSGRVSDSQYYIYVDALTGEEIKVLRVIDSDEGTLLL